ncbi:NAD-dependent epimerase/dehydratase family protein [bacterium CPR1]|nr:NAD-dependent epimerase/dehydratase family protein [bacterium CPR1]
MKALVTGGGGFLGGALARRLLADGHEVFVLGRNRYPEMEALGAKGIVADLADRSRVVSACAGMDVVFHVGARAGLWGSFEDYYNSNVLATINVLDGCREGGVSRLVYTSSPSVTFDGQDHLGADERLGYPRKFLNFYSQTKAMAEKLVLKANGEHGVLTVALRPHIIWGPGDNHILPRLIARARQGKLVRVGDGSNRVDVTYVDNAVEAHLQAAERLEPSAALAGKAYFLSQGQPVVLWDWVNQWLERLGIAPVRRSIPFRAAYTMGAALEKVYGLLGKTEEPRMTRFLACQLARSHYYNLEAARRDLSYQPAVGMAEGMDRTVELLLSPVG